MAEKKLSFPMATNRKKIAGKSGAPPGTLIYVGEESFEKVRITSLSFNGKEYFEQEILQLDRVEDFVIEGNTNWINVDGVHNPEFVKAVCDKFDIHPLVQEDIVNTEQRAKMENYGEYLYFVLKMVELDDQEEEGFWVEQVSIILGKNFILSFQEEPGDIWDPIRGRIRSLETRLVTMGADYLAYRLMDSIVDVYFLILENLGEKIDELEERLIADADKQTLTEIYEVKRELIDLRKACWPMRDIVFEMRRESSTLFDADLEVFLRDFQDHVVRVVETVETYRDTTSSMVDLYMNSVSIKMNEVMKVLTIISTIFIPLTFIAGIYGMNFDAMPELHTSYGYPVVVGLMVIIVGLQIYWFKKKNWL